MQLDNVFKFAGGECARYERLCIKRDRLTHRINKLNIKVEEYEQQMKQFVLPEQKEDKQYRSYYQLWCNYNMELRKLNKQLQDTNNEIDIYRRS